MAKKKRERGSESASLSRREFLRRSALGTAGVGLGLSGAYAAEGNRRRFYRADELTEEHRARLREAKASQLYEEGVDDPAFPWPSND